MRRVWLLSLARGAGLRLRRPSSRSSERVRALGPAAAARRIRGDAATTSPSRPCRSRSCRIGLAQAEVPLGGGPVPRDRGGFRCGERSAARARRGRCARWTAVPRPCLSVSLRTPAAARRSRRVPGRPGRPRRCRGARRRRRRRAGARRRRCAIADPGRRRGGRARPSSRARGSRLSRSTPSASPAASAAVTLVLTWPGGRSRRPLPRRGDAAVRARLASARPRGRRAASRGSPGRRRSCSRFAPLGARRGSRATRRGCLRPERRRPPRRETPASRRGRSRRSRRRRRARPEPSSRARASPVSERTAPRRRSRGALLTALLALARPRARRRARGAPRAAALLARAAPPPRGAGRDAGPRRGGALARDGVGLAACRAARRRRGARAVPRSSRASLFGAALATRAGRLGAPRRARAPRVAARRRTAHRRSARAGRERAAHGAAPSRARRDGASSARSLLVASLAVALAATVRAPRGRARGRGASRRAGAGTTSGRRSWAASRRPIALVVTALTVPAAILFAYAGGVCARARARGARSSACARRARCDDLLLVARRRAPRSPPPPRGSRPSRRACAPGSRRCRSSRSSARARSFARPSSRGRRGGASLLAALAVLVLCPPSAQTAHALPGRRLRLERARGRRSRRGVARAPAPGRRRGRGRDPRARSTPARRGGARVWWPRTAPAAVEAWARDGRLRRDLVARGRTRGRGHRRRRRSTARAATRSTAPGPRCGPRRAATGAYLDEVPLVLVYARAGAWR